MKVSVDFTPSISRMRWTSVEQMAVVLADDLDQQVVAAGREDDVARLLPLRDLLGDAVEIGLGLDADERHHVEPELERVCDRDHIEHAGIGQPVDAGADGRLGDAKLAADRRIGAAAVALEDLDDAAVGSIELTAGAVIERPAFRRLQMRIRS